MAYSLSDVVPWGRSFDEYCRIFSLTDQDLEVSILGCSDGPAAFNAEVTRRGGRCVSIDPLYTFSVEEIQRRIDETAPEVIAQARNNQNEFIWDSITSVDELYRIRIEAMYGFLADFKQGEARGRYIAGQLPELPFSDGEFDLALCSHFLFLYSELLSLDFHLQAIQELCRVANEVRVFPVLSLGAMESPHLTPVMKALEDNCYHAELVQVDYEFQKGGNKMLVIRHGG